MNTGTNSTNQPPSGHVDLDAVTAIQLTVRDPEAVPECRIATPLLQGPIKGIRPLEVASGLSDKQVWEITSSYDGGLSPFGLIRTVERGKSWDSEGREKGIYALAESPRKDVTKTSTYKNPTTPLGVVVLEDLKDLDGYRDVFAGGFSDERVMALADPSSDLWRRSRSELGSAGWRVGMILGFQRVELSAKAWRELVGDEKKAARLAKKMEAHGVLTRTGKARATRYALDWSTQLRMVEEDAENLMSRAKKLQNQHAREQERIQRPASFEEIEVRRRARNAAQYAKPYFDAALEAETPEEKAALEKMGHRLAGATEADWRRWFEMDVEREPGLVPDSPAVLVEEAAVVRPAQESSGAQRFSAFSEQEQQETLAAMRRRVMGLPV
jgi:hypothetical protein